MWLHPEPDEALRLAVQVCAAGQFIGLVELFLARREMAPGGFLDWSMIGLLSPHTRTQLGGLIRRTFRRLPAPAFAALAGLSAAITVLLIAFPASDPLLAAAVILQVARMKRHHLTLDGSDQMTLVVLVACALGRLGGNAVAVRAAVIFLAAELSLSYLVAGVYKAASPYWQSGCGFAMLLQTRTYGHPGAAKLVRRHPTLGYLAAASVVCWESLFVVALTAPPPVPALVLAAGLTFHAGCGVLMGLNRFLWAFAASYPALWYANSALRSGIGSRAADWITVVELIAGGAALAGAFGWRPVWGLVRDHRVWQAREAPSQSRPPDRNAVSSSSPTYGAVPEGRVP